VTDDTAAALDAEAYKYEVAALDPRVTEEQVLEGLPALQAAAQAHLETSRPLDEILAEYSPLLDKHSNGEEVDLNRLNELMAELGPARKAQAILDGALPGTAPVIVAEKNEANGDGA
jgi:hypothetical protein